MAKITLPAKLENLDKGINFILEGARGAGFDDKKLSQIKLACEEIIVNIINYAYPEKEGSMDVEYTLRDDGAFQIQISDEGIPFDPLSLPEPDIGAPLEERKIGGLGIYLVRKVMDEVTYRRVDNKNVITLLKKP